MVLTGLYGDRFHDAVSAFSLKVQRPDIVAFFYAGHAVLFDQVNYPLPVDIKIESVYDLERKAVLAHKVVEAMQRGARASVILLNACRNTPLTRARSNSRCRRRRALVAKSCDKSIIEAFRSRYIDTFFGDG